MAQLFENLYLVTEVSDFRNFFFILKIIQPTIDWYKKNFTKIWFELIWSFQSWLPWKRKCPVKPKINFWIFSIDMGINRRRILLWSFWCPDYIFWTIPSIFRPKRVNMEKAIKKKCDFRFFDITFADSDLKSGNLVWVRYLA